MGSLGPIGLVLTRWKAITPYSVYQYLQRIMESPGVYLNITIPSYQHRVSHYKDKTVSRPSYLFYGNHRSDETICIETKPRSQWLKLWENCSDTHCEGKIERTRNSVFPWEHVLHIPRDKQIDQRINDEHEEHVTHSQVIILAHWQGQVAPPLTGPWKQCCHYHYCDVTRSAMASQITSFMIVYSAVYSGADQRKYQSSTSLALWVEFTGYRWIPLTKGQLRGKCFHLMTSSWWKKNETGINRNRRFADLPTSA